MRTLILLSILLFAPSIVSAQKVVILPVSYIRAETNKQVPEAATKLEGKISEGATEAGFEIMKGSVVKTALKELSTSGAVCENIEQECLVALTKKLGADEAIYLRATDEDQTSYKLEIILARRNRSTDQRTAGFFVVLEWVRGAVALVLQKSVNETEEGSNSENDPLLLKAPAKTDDKRSSEIIDEATRKDETDKKILLGAPDKDGFSPVPFYVLSAVTGALLAGWGITDIIVHKRYNDLKDSDDSKTWKPRVDDAKSLQKVDRFLLGATLVGLVATGITFFLTDFDSESDKNKKQDDDKPSALLIPAALSNGGMLVLQGNF